ncbi:MAG: AAA family ATPase [bacterium]
MKLLELKLQAFGRLSNRVFSFHPQVNVITGPNEAGKSTLQHAILALLYGFYDNARALQREQEMHERFRPWSAERYAGSLTYRLDDGATLVVHRDFVNDDVPTQLLDANTGEDLTHRYARGRHGKIDFIEKQLGMSRTVFLHTAFVQQGELRSFKPRDAAGISDAILSLLDSAATETSAERALDRLDKILREQFSERSQKTVLAQAHQRLDGLHENRALRQAMQRAVQHEVEKAETLALEIDELEAQAGTLERQLLTMQLELLRARLRRWQDNESHRQKLNVEIAELAALEDFPVALKEQFFQLRDEFLHLEKTELQLADERNSIELRLMGLQEKSGRVPIPGQFWQSASFENFLALRQRWQSAFEEVIGSESARHAAEDHLRNAGIGEEERRVLASLDAARLEQYRELEAKLNEAEAEANGVRAEFDAYGREFSHRRSVLGFVAGIALLTMVSSLAHIGMSAPGTSHFGDGMLILLSFAILMGCVAVKVRTEATGKELRAELLEAEQRFMTERRKLRDVLLQYRVDSLNELMQRRMQFVELGAAIAKHQQLMAEMEKIEKGLKPWLAEMGIGHIAMETVQEAEKHLRESHQLYTSNQSLHQRLQEISRQEEELRKNLQSYAGQLEKILQRSGLEEPVGEKAFQAFLAAYQKREYLDTLLLQRQQAETLSHEILEGETAAALSGQIEQLEKQWAALPAPASAAAPPQREVAESAIAALRTTRDHVQREIHQQQQALSILQERIAVRLQGLPPLAEIEEEIALEEAQRARYETAKKALELARDRVAQAAQRLHRNFGPRLKEFVSGRLATLTAGRYTGVLIDPATFSMRVERGDHAAPVDLERLSHGTREQIYLLLRAAVVDLFAQGAESAPLFWDDPLVHADDERQHQALELCRLLAEQHQIFYFTKDQSVVQYFSERYGPAVVLTLA